MGIFRDRRADGGVLGHLPEAVGGLYEAGLFGADYHRHAGQLRPAVAGYEIAAAGDGLRHLARYNDGVLARANPTEEVTEMFCNFDCASLLKMLCSFFGC